MYRGPPLFDVPELPALRRVKPLPKRRRTSTGAPRAKPPTSATFPLPIPCGDSTTVEEFVAHADALSAHMAIQSFYIPVLGGVKGLFSGEVDLTDFGLSGEKDEEKQRENDYIDHLQQPGNTKKRKVPANASGSSSGGHDLGSSTSGGEDEGSSVDRNVTSGRSGGEAQRASSVAAINAKATARKGKMSPATLAGLQHKEMLKNRKRQLAAVLGALSNGNALALDQALSANYPIATGLGGSSKHGEQQKIRLSRREGPRLARAAKSCRMAVTSSIVAPFPQCEFTFRCPSATSDRLIATKKEVVKLRNQFEAELARQADKAAKLAAANKLMASLSLNGVWSKRGDRNQQRGGSQSEKGGGEANENANPSRSKTKSREGKKKTTSLANASNPHHLRNYVPSRHPYSGQTNATQNQNWLNPFPIQFLSAQLPPRRKKSYTLPQMTNPPDEWICPRCEYELFYGEEFGYRRAVRNRKKILRRRRRARERAAVAANGNGVAKVGEKLNSTFTDYDAPAVEPAVSQIGSTTKQPGKWKGDPEKESERKGFSSGTF